MRTEVHLPLLERARIASPCPVKWEDMTGDDTVRHCARCNLNVFNFSTMPPAEAEALLQRKVDDPSQRLCAGFFRRADGTVILKDCPVGLAAARARVVRVAGRIAAALGLLALAGYSTARSQQESERERGWGFGLREFQPFKAVADWLNPRAAQYFTPGDICIPPPPAPPTLAAPANAPTPSGPNS